MGFSAVVCHFCQNICFSFHCYGDSVVCILFMVISTAPLVNSKETKRYLWPKFSLYSRVHFMLSLTYSDLILYFIQSNFTNLLLRTSAKFYIWQVLGLWKKSTAGVDIMKQHSSVPKWSWCWWKNQKHTQQYGVYLNGFNEALFKNPAVKMWLIYICSLPVLESKFFIVKTDFLTLQIVSCHSIISWRTFTSM